MSSPAEGKVSYAQLEDFVAINQAVHPLIDAGLKQPHGLAYDPARSALLVADAGQRKIFRYGLRVRARADGGGGGEESNVGYEIVVHESQRAIVQNVMVRWVSVDTSGNVYFTDEEQGTVNRLDASVVQKLADGVISAGDLRRATEYEASASTQSESAIHALYGPAQGALVSNPMGVAVDGDSILWANAGAGVGGAVDSLASGSLRLPGPPAGSPSAAATPLPAPLALARGSGPACGVAVSNTMVVYSSLEHNLNGVCNGDGRAVVLASGFTSPRGLAWDGDNTVYIADSNASAVLSLPTGRCRKNLVPRHTVNLHGVFGLALIRASDPSFAAVLGGEGAGGGPEEDGSGGWLGGLFGTI